MWRSPDANWRLIFDLVALEKDDEDADEAVDLVSLVKEAMGNSPALQEELEADLGEDCSDGLACSAVFLRAEQAQSLRGDRGTLTFDALRLEIDAARQRSARRLATKTLWRVRDAWERASDARPWLNATAALVLQALDWLLVFWLVLLLAILPRCSVPDPSSPDGELVPRWPELALRRKHLETLVADRVVSAADALGLRGKNSGGGGDGVGSVPVPRSSLGATSDETDAPAAATGSVFRRCHSCLERLPSSSSGHFSPLRLGLAALSDAARTTDDALSDPRLHAAWIEVQAAATDSFARLVAALADDPAACAHEALAQLRWCKQQAPAAANALCDKVRCRGLRCVAQELANECLAAVLSKGRAARSASDAFDARATAPRPSPLLSAPVRPQSPRLDARGTPSSVTPERDSSTSPRSASPQINPFTRKKKARETPAQ